MCQDMFRSVRSGELTSGLNPNSLGTPAVAKLLPSAAQLHRGPRFLGREHCIFEAHRKQHHCGTLPHLGERLSPHISH